MITVPEHQLQTVEEVQQDKQQQYNRWGYTTDGGTHLWWGNVFATPLNTVEHDVTVENGKYLIDGDLLETLDLEEGKTYRFDQSDSSNATHSLRFSEAVDGTEYTDELVTFGTPGSANAFSQITIPYKSPDLNIICENHAGMGLALTTSTPFAGTLISSEGSRGLAYGGTLEFRENCSKSQIKDHISEN